MNEMQDAILKVVKLSSPNATGFRAVRCAVCQDYKVRGGFKFEPDGSIIYNCFRGKCDANAIWRVGEAPTHKFKRLMSAFHVEIPAELLLPSSTSSKAKVYDTGLYTEHQYQSDVLPAGVVRYVPQRYPLVREFLESRGLSNDDEYYVGVSGHWLNRLLTPFYYADVLIGWEGRYLFSSPYKPFYEKSHKNSHLLYIPNGKIPETPIVVEGVFDAKSIPFGVATLHSALSPEQAYLLRNVKPMLLPDRKGSRFMDVAEKYGWPVIIPEYKEKDANAALQRMGRLALALELSNNVYSDLRIARLRYQLWTSQK